MKKIRFRTLLGAGFIFLFSLNISLITAGLISNLTWFIVAAIILSAGQMVLHNLFRRKHSILRYYPFRYKLKHLSGKISPFLSKSFFGDDSLRRVVSSKQYELILNRAKNIPGDIVRNTLTHPDDPDFECLRYIDNRKAVEPKVTDLKVTIGTPQCRQPYSLSILTIGALNQKLLSNASILALSEGANIQACAVNTGQGGISPYLIRGGSDLIWQLSHEDYAFRKEDSSFNEKLFQVTATRPYVKMIELVLPRHEVNIMKRLAGDRMISFLNRLRTLSEGKPIGIRLFNPGRDVINGICKSMLSARIYLDFITIDGTVSADGPDSFSISKASLRGYFEALTYSRKTIDSYGLPTKILASGLLVSEYDILRSVALGANACYCTTPMVLAIGSNSRFRSNEAMNQRVRVANFHRNTIEATVKLMELCGYQSLDQVKPADFYRKTDFFKVKSLKEIYFDEHPVREAHLFSGLS
ncbi:glutamate synthase-related protein [Pedobacter sp. P351]|uniref:glutamate synthase-related protein n=1 Tax=Pedobacter superstes TaxID=3133441 RepID=UPI0030992572